MSVTPSLPQLEHFLQQIPPPLDGTVKDWVVSILNGHDFTAIREWKATYPIERVPGEPILILKLNVEGTAYTQSFYYEDCIPYLANTKPPLL